MPITVLSSRNSNNTPTKKAREREIHSVNSLAMKFIVT